MTDRAAAQEHPAVGATAPDDNDPATLHRIMQSMIGEGLKKRYAPPQKLSHELFVLMMQLKENERRRKARSAQTKRTDKGSGRGDGLDGRDANELQASMVR